MQKLEKPTRILHIVGNLQRGGVESVVYNYYRAMDKSKIQFDIAVDTTSVFGVPADILALGMNVYKISPYTKPLKYMRALVKLYKRNGYTVVHSHMNAMSLFPLFAAFISGVPVRIAHNHSTAGKGNDFKRDLLKYLLRPFAKIFATHYFACTKHAARWLFGSTAVKRGKVTIVKNAIDTSKFAFDYKIRGKTRNELGLTSKYVIGHIGRFSPQKNHSFLIDVFNAVCKKKEDAVLVLIGALGSAGGGIEEIIHEKIKNLGIEDRVIFLGASEDISAYYQAFDVFVLPSLYEGLGMVAIEAQVSGLPCVLSSRVPREAKLIDNVDFLSLNTDAAEWAEVIVNMKSERSDCSAEIGKAGYDIKKEAKKLEHLYLKFIQGLK